MENAMSSSRMKATRLRTTNENASPLRIELSPRFQRYTENINVGSPLARLLFAGSPISGRFSPAGEASTPPPSFPASKYRSTRAQQYYSSSSGSSSFGSRGRTSLSPLSSIENLELAARMSPPMYGTPVKSEEEVLVMDDILVKRTSGGKSGKSSSSTSSGGRGSSSSSSKSVIKTEICKAWEESGNCRYNSMCQFAHGKEELHPVRPSMKSKSEAQTGKLTSRAGSVGSCKSSPNNRIRIVHQLYAAAENERGVTRSQPASPEPHHHTLASSNTLKDWSPMDDGIEVLLPGSDKAPSREEVDAHISSLLSGPTTKRRLPVFAALCKGQE